MRVVSVDGADLPVYCAVCGDSRARGEGRRCGSATPRAFRILVPGTAGELLRAQLDIQAKRYSDAIGTLEKLAGPPEQPSFSVWFALACGVLVKPTASIGAADAFLAAIALKPELPRPYLYRGVALLATGRIDAAIEAFDRFISLRPDEPHASAIRIGACADSAQSASASIDGFGQGKEGGSPARFTASLNGRRARTATRPKQPRSMICC